MNITIPLTLSILNRAFNLFDEPPEPTVTDAMRALTSAEGRMSTSLTFSDKTPVTPLARAIAEYISRSGPWEAGREFEDEDGYTFQ